MFDSDHVAIGFESLIIMLSSQKTIGDAHLLSFKFMTVEEEAA